MVADPHPLKILLRYHWVQEYIDEGLVLSHQGSKKTALTVAVSFGNVAQVFLLLSEFPRAVDAPVGVRERVAPHLHGGL
jgi:hypothetical protein